MSARLYLSAAHKSSGKTTVAIGVCAALSARGLIVQPYKKGPDYIDPLWLTKAAGRACYNLDFHTMEASEIDSCFRAEAVGADILVVEGNKGLFDGVAVDGSNSNAALAHQLKTPVVLVLDAKGVSRGVAPLVLGYRHFDPSLPIAGVILNRVAGARHEAKLRAVLKAYTDVPVLGAVAESLELTITERHLGLVPSGEWGGADLLIARLARAIEDGVDVAALAALGTGPQPGYESARSRSVSKGWRLGIARDAAFSFYYPGDLVALERLGAELVFFDTVNDPGIPAVDALFIGGGFPETQASALAANVGMRASIRAAIESGLPAYAECGGLMYLSQSLTWHEQTYPMAGVLPGRVVMEERPVGHGYMVLRPTAAHPWAFGSSGPVPAHEFHYSRLVDLDPKAQFAFTVDRGQGVDGHHDGLIYKNLVAQYAHLRDTKACPWTERFAAFVAHRRRRLDEAARGDVKERESCENSL